MFVPLWDMNQLKRVKFQYVTIGLITINCLIYFIFETHLVLSSPASFVDALALKPRDVETMRAFVDHMPDQFRLVTYMFLHGSILHLLGNMIFLFVFGDNVEDALGHVRFFLFYVVCGVAAGVVHSIVTTSPDVPLIGASGAIAGVIGAYLMLHPNIRVWVLFQNPIIPFLPLRFSAGAVIGVWIAYQIICALYLTNHGTAWWAHIGGFFTGALLIVVMKRRGVPLFDSATGV
ncbi:Rhomboid family protein [Rhodomicrobium vannielii ATCC 17100]|uniref:Rhomboid family protein n=1 Tax=Rhodomicrobium vannielii (strain ATCC 17100 / DSM 162 / LMG 4299 / NCIMB 10020 / ATH 3.1.1) TaxID=648757 RepID=E3I436_RHOVT|nr:rhomboid family intramembrane serine protease [Rhodomicrobium vannielii]ADP72685.1 Rhomboid family protein [Rhodomicrobium vannielii ATCC 17100]